MGLKEDIDEDAKKYGGTGGGDTFEFKKGVNTIRILAKPKIIATHFFGRGNPSVVCVGIDEGCKFHGEKDKLPSKKLATYVLNRETGRVQLAELPLSLNYALNDLQQDSEYAFDDFPIPYDIKVKHDPDNDDPKAKYRIVAPTNMTSLTKDEVIALEKEMAVMTPEQYVEKRKAKQKAKSGDAPTHDDAPDYDERDMPM